MPVRRRSEVKGAPLNGKATPVSSHGENTLIQQPWTPIAKGWIQYALIGLMIFVVLRILILLVALTQG